ncbi:hypothetical protein [Halomontanus rarus]|uniref:hypothetical protein n=1 Tax=Halomontanus rarus TaxID=3034020 RepID=UPI0023E7D4E5|nr:hypothetical protein [Halovivax sp. TS33]
MMATGLPSTPASSPAAVLPTRARRCSLVRSRSADETTVHEWPLERRLPSTEMVVLT